MMRFSQHLVVRVWPIILICFVASCSKGRVTQLAPGFNSYDTASVIRERLKQAAPSNQWQEEEKGTSRSDPRPAYRFLTMSGPFRLWGIGGNLKLVFYNDRLMSTEFSTSHGTELLTAMNHAGTPVPEKPGIEISLDRHTSFRYDLDSTGVLRFSWRDTKLEDEWQKWVRANS
jgi:hypothetical protein